MFGPPPPINVVALLLAAGLSIRARPYNKLAATMPGDPEARPIVRASAEALLASYANQVIVVTGHQSKKIEYALADLDVIFVHNPDFSSGMSGSLATGVNALPETASAAVVALGDMPSLSSETVNALITAFSPSAGQTICIPIYDERRGNPILFGKRHFAELANLTGDRGGKPVVERNPNAIAEVNVSDPGVHVDFDTL